jgi:hypothetical protein
MAPQRRDESREGQAAAADGLPAPLTVRPRAEGVRSSGRAEPLDSRDGQLPSPARHPGPAAG